MRLATGLLAPDSGQVEVLGVDMLADPAAAKRHLAYLPDEPMVYGKLKPTEYLEFVAGLWGIGAAEAEPRARHLLEWLDLSAHAHELVEGFSRGMKQKLALAGALIHAPQLLILDEPLTGLDAAAARQVKDLLQQHVADGGTVVLTTHILEVAERLAQRIGIIRAGRLVAEGTLEDVFLQLTEEPA